MSGFDIALSLFFISAVLFVGRYLHNKEEMTDEEKFRNELTKRRLRQKLHGERVEARQKERVGN